MTSVYAIAAAIALIVVWRISRRIVLQTDRFWKPTVKIPASVIHGDDPANPIIAADCAWEHVMERTWMWHVTLLRHHSADRAAGIERTRERAEASARASMDALNERLGVTGTDHTHQH